MPTTLKAKLLVVDDDPRLRELLVRYLTEQSFQTTAVADAVQMDRRLTRERYDLLILDLMLPKEDGLSICRRIVNSAHALPILILTAKGDDVDKIVGLEIGADDYLLKPFNPRELVARVNAILRRSGHVSQHPGAPLAQANLVHFGQNTLNLTTRILQHKGQEAFLTTGEFSLLKVLVQHPRIPLSRERLMELARGREYEIFDRAIDVQISRLRKLIEPDHTKPRYIQTVWGLGYVFVPDDEVEAMTPAE